jgi:hypothetical protein
VRNSCRQPVSEFTWSAEIDTLRVLVNNWWNSRWEFNGKSHHLLYKHSYYWFPLLSPVFHSTPICYRMIRRGRRLSLPLTNNTHKQQIKNRIIHVYTLRYQYSQNRHDTKKKTPWLWSGSELCRPSDRRLLAK